MAKCLSAVFQSVVFVRPVAISYHVFAVLSKRKFSSIPDECFRRDGSDHSKTNDADRERQRLLRIAIIGVPNAGKSSLINSIVQRGVCPYSCKVHTTKSSVRAIRNVDLTQLVFLDTPGLVDSKEITKYNLDKTFANDSVNSIEEADIIGVIHDVSNRYTRHHLDPKVLRLLNLYAHKDSFLVLNKIDLLKSKRHLLDLARSLTCYKHEKFHIPESHILKPNEKIEHKGSKVQERMLEKKVKKSVGWDKFKDVFMVSAILNQGSSDIEEYLLQQSKPSPWMFPENVLTDKQDHKLVLNIVESILYDDLPNEVPYNLKVELEYYEISREGNIHIVVLICCDTPRIEKLIMGQKGKRIRNLARMCEQRLRDLFMVDVFLKMVVTKKQNSSIELETDTYNW